VPIDPEDVREHYVSLSDDELVAVERSDLTPMAQQIFDAELERRDLKENYIDPPESADDEDDSQEGFFSLETADESEPEEDWVENGFPASVFSSSASGATNAAEARDALMAAGVPCAIREREIDPAEEAEAPPPSYKEYWLMVPPSFSLKATSVLDKAIFNPAMESDWKTQLASLSNEELRSLDVDDICSGLVDRAERLRKLYKNEVSRRLD
jgi:hypothetical protein